MNEMFKFHMYYRSLRFNKTVLLYSGNNMKTMSKGHDLKFIQQ